jgi:hypothetical protein
MYISALICYLRPAGLLTLSGECLRLVNHQLYSEHDKIKGFSASVSMLIVSEGSSSHQPCIHELSIRAKVNEPLIA